MILFLDTEFTDLSIEPRLLSIGIVASSPGDSEFYAEVNDRDRLRAACWFALDVVLPQFGKVAHAACPYASIGARLRGFIDRTLASLPPDETVDVAFTFDLDWQLATRALRDGGTPLHDGLWRRLRGRNVYDRVGFDSGKRASDAYFSKQADAPIGRHHALCDARALRVAYAAVGGQRDEAQRTAPLTAPVRSGQSRAAPVN